MAAFTSRLKMAKASSWRGEQLLQERLIILYLLIVDAYIISFEKKHGWFCNEPYLKIGPIIILKINLCIN